MWPNITHFDNWGGKEGSFRWIFGCIILGIKITHFHAFWQLGGLMGAFLCGFCLKISSNSHTKCKWGEVGVFYRILCILTIGGANGGHFVVFLRHFGVILGVKMQIGGRGAYFIEFLTHHHDCVWFCVVFHGFWQLWGDSHGFYHIFICYIFMDTHQRWWSPNLPKSHHYPYISVYSSLYFSIY